MTDTITAEELADFFLEYGTDLSDDAEAQLEKYYRIKKAKPEIVDEREGGFTWSDGGLTRLFAQIYGKEAIYCIEHKCWYVFHDGKWQQDIGALYIAEKLLEFSLLMRVYANNDIEDYIKEDSSGKKKSFKKAYVSFVANLEAHQVRERILKDARALMKAHVDIFDTNPKLINLQNGIYFYNTHSLSPSNKDEFCSMQAKFALEKTSSITSLVNYKDKYKYERCERWEQFISEVCEGDNAKIDFLQRALGYSLFGDGREECMFILYGNTTRNGKSTLLNTISHLLGDYAKVAPIGLICKQKASINSEAPSPVLASLKGVRFVTLAESNAYGSLDEEQIKRLTGGEEITARALYQSSFSYRPQFVMWLSCNDLPTVNDKSIFASQRIHVINFNHHFSQAEQDKNLKKELTNPISMQGIFLWLVEGYEKYEKRGLEKTIELQEETDLYEKENDIVLLFLEDKCERGSEEDRISAKELYQSFKSWARSQGEEIYSAKKFYAEMRRHPDCYATIVKPQNKTIYLGIKWKENL